MIAAASDAQVGTSLAGVSARDRYAHAEERSRHERGGLRLPPRREERPVRHLHRTVIAQFSEQIRRLFAHRA